MRQKENSIPKSSTVSLDTKTQSKKKPNFPPNFNIISRKNIEKNEREAKSRLEKTLEKFPPAPPKTTDELLGNLEEHKRDIDCLIDYEDEK